MSLVFATGGRYVGFGGGRTPAGVGAGFGRGGVARGFGTSVAMAGSDVGSVVDGAALGSVVEAAAAVSTDAVTSGEAAVLVAAAAVPKPGTVVEVWVAAGCVGRGCAAGAVDA